MPNFELNKHDWYEVQNVEENDFLNQKLASTDYGIYYSIKFAGDADTYIWQTKTPPVEGEKYWGWLEKSKSGKSVKFKWDKQNTPDELPNGKPAPQAKENRETQDSIFRSVALEHAVKYSKRFKSVHDKGQDALEVADNFYAWLTKNTGSQGSSPGLPTYSRTEKETQAEKTRPARDTEWDEPVFDPESGDRIL